MGEGPERLLRHMHAKIIILKIKIDGLSFRFPVPGRLFPTPLIFIRTRPR
jgi:hypothetical protein